MLNIWLKLLKGNLIWRYLCLKNHISSTTAILFLTGENSQIDEYALKYLDCVMDRKRCDEAVIFVEAEDIFQFANLHLHTNKVVKIKKISPDYVTAIYNWYRVVRFNKNMFFTYTDRTKDNLLGRFMRETDINEKDAVCLAIYNFRSIMEE